MAKYSDEELDLIARHVNGFVRQDGNGNVVWNSSPDAETGWRPIYEDECREAIEAQRKL
jgi:hypothetical protein